VDSAEQQEPELPEDEELDTQRSWFAEPWTRSLGKAMREEAQKSLAELLRLCGGSSDPEVREAFARYTVQSRAAALFFPKGKK
jgi:hypothetical protein